MNLQIDRVTQVIFTSNSFYRCSLVIWNVLSVHIKDTRREKALSNKTRLQKRQRLQKYKYGDLGCWCNKSTFYKKFIN